MVAQVSSVQSSPTKRLIAAARALLTWMAVVVQLILMLQNRTTPVEEAVIRFFSFFTILTNTLVALCFTNLALAKKQRFSFSLLSATAVYILVVAIVYNIVLRSTWNPQGLQKLVDEALHTIVPIVYIGYWAVFLRKVYLSWKLAISWLLYPFVYLVFILLRGAASDFYPYPFVNVTALGYEKVFINSAWLLVVFTVFNVIFIGLTRWSQKGATPD